MTKDQEKQVREIIHKVCEDVASHFGRQFSRDIEPNMIIDQALASIDSIFTLDEGKVEKAIGDFVDKHNSLQGSQYRMSDYCTSKKEEEKCLTQQKRDIEGLAQSLTAPDADIWKEEPANGK